MNPVQQKKPTAKPESKNLNIKPSTYQPSRRELREKHDMPGMNDKQIRNAFFRTVQSLKNK